MSAQKVETPGIVTGATSLTGSVISALGSVIAFISVIFGVLGLIVSALPFIFITIVATTIMIPFVGNLDKGIEQAEFGLRTKVYPIWRDTVREFVNLLRNFYNPLICYWNAFNWWFFGLYREALFPTLTECGIATVLANLGRFLFAVFADFVRYFLGFEWIQGNELDFTEICNTWIVFFNSWIDLYTCACFDIGDILRATPAFTIFVGVVNIPPTWLFFNPFSEQLADPQTWCFISNSFNGTMALVGVFMQLIIAIFNAIFFPPPPSPFPRPDFRRAFDFYCDALSCFVRSFENAFQRLWDNYVPFKFVFHEWLCALDTAACIILNAADNLLRILINIDRVVQYPNDDFYERVIKPDFIEWINLFAPATAFDPVLVPTPPNPTRFVITNYFLSTTEETRPASQGGGPNPLFGKKRLSECLGIFIERTVCDPSNESTACFSTTAQQILMDFDFECYGTTILKTLIDLLSGFFEFTLHLANGADEFFLFIDENPFPTVLKDDLVDFASCTMSIFTLIPEIGTCIRDLIVETLKWILCQIDFLVRVILGVGTLPYFLIAMSGTPNFVTRMDEALDFFVMINNNLITMEEGSFLYCLSRVINSAFPVPPIPCSRCEVQIFPGVPVSKRLFSQEDPIPTRSPMDLVARVFGPSVYTKRVTPLLSYHNTSMHPLHLGKKIWENSDMLFKEEILPLSSLKQVDRFVDYQKSALLDRWDRINQCNQLDQESERVKKENLKLWVYKEKRGEWTDDTCPPVHERTWNYQNKHEPPQTRGFVQQQDTRLTLAPTDPPLASCGNAFFPDPPCFDLACVFRTTLELFVHLLNFTARFLNGFIQGVQDTVPPTGNFRYFTGEACDVLNEDCFESDLVTGIILFVAPLQCLCEFINLVIPVTPQNPRGDLCCFIQRAGELLACILQVIINAITGLANGAQNDYLYFRSNMFFEDVSTLFDITIELIDCLCTLIRGLFPLAYIPGFNEATNFDICCAPRALLVSIIELIRLLIQIIIALATINATPESFCYFRLDTTKGCPGTLDEIGMVKQFDVVINSFLTTRDAQCDMNCGNDHGRGGIAPCACQVINSLLPFRSRPLEPINCEDDVNERNCMIVDFCCPIVKTAIALNDLAMFGTRLLVGVWQSWSPGYPEFLVNYMFCDEPNRSLGVVADCITPTSCAISTTPACGCGTFTCGKLMPFIDALLDPREGLFADCVCEYVRLLDVLLADYIGLGNWSADNGCFCGITNGILRQVNLLAKSLVNAIINLARRFPLPCFWKPCSGDQGTFNIESSFIFAWLGPVADAFCLSVSTLGCFINNLFFPFGSRFAVCETPAKRLFGGAARWLFEIVFFVFALIEGFIRNFTQESPTCLGNDCAEGAFTGSAEVGGNRFYGDPLGQMIAILFTLPVDILLGDSEVACTTICNPKFFAAQSYSDELYCSCYNASPQTKLTPNLFAFGTDSREWVNIGTMNFYGYTAAPGYPTAIINRYCQATIEGVSNLRPLCSVATCYNEKLCRPDTLPGCGRHPDTPFESVDPSGFFRRSVDGVLMSIIRYLRCIIQRFGLPDLFGIIVKILSVVWQIWGGVARFLASLLIFVLSLFGLSLPLGLITIASRLFNVLGAFFDIFKQPLFLPDKRVIEDANDRSSFIGPVQRQSFHQFKERAYHFMQNDESPFEAFAYVLYDYDVDDCFDDLPTCICRNMPMQNHCEWTLENGLNYTNGAFNTQELLTFVAQVFPGASVCDAIIQDCDHADIPWADVPFAIKTQYVQCIDYRVRGERLHHVMPFFPENYFYTDRSKLFVFHAAYQHLAKFVRQEQFEQAKQASGYDSEEAFKRHLERRQEEERQYKKKLDEYDQELFERKFYIRQRMRDVYGYDTEGIGFEVVERMDEIWYKWYSGYYGHIAYRAAQLIERGESKLLPTPEQALQNILYTGKDMFTVLKADPNDQESLLQHTMRVIHHTRRLGQDIYNKGILAVKNEMTSRLWAETAKDPEYIQRQEYLKQERAKWMDMWQHSPLKLLWDYVMGNTKIVHDKDYDARWFGPFRDHMSNVIQYAQEHDDAPWSAWNAAKRFRETKKQVVKRYTEPNWTPEIQRNWAKVQGMFYKVYDAIWPNSLPRDVQERFIFGCNCVLADRLLDTTLMLVDYCVYEFMPNLNVQKFNETKQVLGKFLNSTSGYRKKGFNRFGYRDQFAFHTPQDPDAWIRPKKIIPPTANRTWYDRNVYLRATTSGSGPAGFNFLDWVVCTLSDWFSDDLSQRLDKIIEDIIAFVENDTTDVADYPDVGLLYWVTFFFRCEWPEYLNCSLGVGLEEAMKIGLIAFGIVIIVSFVLPGPTGAILAVLSFVLWVIIVPIIAWHYSPQCWLMTPSFPLTSGWNIPIWPVPVAFPALPECAMDEIVGLLDKFITDCYDFWIPDYMVNGDVCPADPNQVIDVVSCKDVGVSDGIQNLLYLGYWTIGSDFVMFMINLAGTCIGMLWPGLNDYLQTTLDGFINASDTQAKRQRFCFYATLPTVLLPLLFVFLFGMFLGLVVPAVVDLIRSLFEVLFATPAAEAIPGTGGQEWFNVPGDDQTETPVGLYDETGGEMDIVETNIGNVQDSYLDRVSKASAYYLNHLVWPRKEKEKKE